MLKEGTYKIFRRAEGGEVRWPSWTLVLEITPLYLQSRAWKKLLLPPVHTATGMWHHSDLRQGLSTMSHASASYWQNRYCSGTSTCKGVWSSNSWDTDGSTERWEKMPSANQQYSTPIILFSRPSVRLPSSQFSVPSLNSTLSSWDAKISPQWSFL